MHKIFLSYRREESTLFTGRIYDRLATHFGRDCVFMDMDAIPIGVDFRKHVIDAVGSCDVLLAIIGDKWLTISHNGQRRLDDPRDFVRMEIEVALQRGIPVIPVLLDRASMPREDELPAAIAVLAYRNGPSVDPGRDFHNHMERLIRDLDQLLGKVKSGVITEVDIQPQFVSPAPPKIGHVITNALGVKFAWVPAGKSWLGGGDGKVGTTPFTLERGLWCGIYPVTQAEWRLVMNQDPSSCGDHPRLPVESVSLNDVQDFLTELNQDLNGNEYSYRLPTEQEWEYICRGGPISQEQSKYHYYFAKSRTDLRTKATNDLSKISANFGNQHHGPNLVGIYLPNPLGMFDLHGNVWEWTSTSTEHSVGVVRGGSWYYDAKFCRASGRGAYQPRFSHNDLGFRLLAVPISQ
jgi:hypothetical protein